MEILKRDVMNYIFKYTDIKLLKKDKDELRNFLESYDSLIDNCLVINTLFNSKPIDFKKNVKKQRLSRHHCILCDNIFTSKNKKNIPLFFQLLEDKIKCFSCKQVVTNNNIDKTGLSKINCDSNHSKTSSYSFDMVESFFDLDQFIYDLLKFINLSYKEIYDDIKSHNLSKLEFKNLLKKCYLIQDLLYTIYSKNKVDDFYDDLKKRCEDNCFICNIIFKSIKTVNDITDFFNIFLKNIKDTNSNNHLKQTEIINSKTFLSKKESQNRVCKTKQINNEQISETTNFFIYDKKYLENEYINKKLNKKSIFTLFVSNKNPRLSNQWVLIFKNKDIFEKLRKIGIFKNLLGIVRYFMLPIIHYYNNETKYLTYEELCVINKSEWKSYCKIHVDSFFKIKKLYESLIELSDKDKKYYSDNYYNIKKNPYINLSHYPPINENSFIEKFLIVHLKILEDCKRLINILYNIDEIKFKNLYKYLTPFRMDVLNDIFGNIIMSWTHISANKKHIFEKVNFKYDYKCEYDINNIIKIDKKIFNILNNSDTEKKDELQHIDLNDTEKIEDSEYSPELVQKEIDILKKNI